MSESADHYKTLQVDAEAEFEVIQAAYRRLARKYHPDAAEGAAPPAAAPPAAAAPAGRDAAVKMAALNAAWEVLRDPARRAAYDAQRRAAAPGPARFQDPPHPAPPTSTHPGTPADHIGSPEWTSPDWGSGRSTVGGGYDPTTMRTAQGTGAAGPPPGRPSGSVVNFGRYAGWSLGEIARRDLEYLEWLERAPIGRQYQAELDQLLRAAGRRRAVAQDQGRRGLFRRR